MTTWITTTEASRISGYSLYHLRELIQSERIRGQKFGRTWQVDESSLRSYMAVAARRGLKPGPKPEQERH